MSINLIYYFFPFQSGVLRTSENAYKKYLSSRPVASTDANARVKKMKFFALKPLEDFIVKALPKLAAASGIKTSKSIKEITEEERDLQNQKHDLLLKMRNFKPHNVILNKNILFIHISLLFKWL